MIERIMEKKINLENSNNNYKNRMIENVNDEREEIYDPPTST